MKQQTRTYTGNAVALLGYLLLIPGAIVTSFVLISVAFGGIWSLGHIGPLLLIGAPLLMGAVGLIFIGSKIKKG
jgi:hypothetical protein